MKIVLLHPATNFANASPVLGLAFLSAILKRNGHEVFCIDGAAPYHTHTNESLVDECEKIRPDLIGITATTERVKFTYHLLYLLRNRLGSIPIISGGPHISVRPVEAVAHGFDVAVIGPAESRVCEICEAAQSKDLNRIKQIPGVAFKDEQGQILLTAPLEHDVFDINSLFPNDLSSFTLSDYIRKPSDSFALGNLIVGRGCPGQCTFCDRSMFGSRLQMASVDTIIGEMISRKQKYSVTRFVFWDDTLTWNKKNLVELCEKIIANRELQGITWSCKSRADLSDQSILSLMKKAGCEQVSLGVENANAETILKIRKGLKIDKMSATIQEMLKAQLKVNVHLMTGFPWETVVSVRQNREFVQTMIAIGVKHFFLNYIIIPYPDTPLYDDYLYKHSESYNWWLRDDLLYDNNNASALYEIDTAPFYKKLFWQPESINVKNEFFGVYQKNPALKKETELFVNYLHEFNNNNNHTTRYLKFKAVRMLVSFVGILLYKLSPRLESAVWKVWIHRK